MSLCRALRADWGFRAGGRLREGCGLSGDGWARPLRCWARPLRWLAMPARFGPMSGCLMTIHKGIPQTARKNSAQSGMSNQSQVVGMFPPQFEH